MYLIEETDERFYIEKSTIDTAGWGCFTKELMKKGDFMEIIGALVRTGSTADNCTHYAKRYKFAASEKKDAKVVPMGFGGIVNHTDDKEKQNVFLTYLPKNRQKKSIHATQVVYMALRDIQPGEEILGNYGDFVDKEIKKYNENVKSLLSDKEEWDRFISFDLYGLKDIIKDLKS